MSVYAFYCYIFNYKEINLKFLFPVNWFMVSVKWKCCSLNLISITKSVDFAVLQQFFKFRNSKRFKNCNNSFICFIAMSMCMLLFCNNSLTKFSAWAPTASAETFNIYIDAARTGCHPCFCFYCFCHHYSLPG